ncbi:MAG: pyridoxamine 5'-phosphate oxidase family protein [Actinomycetota bacterium]
MATWDEFAASDPELGAYGHERLHKHGIGLAYLATVRHDDGGPRVHPTCPYLAEGRLYVAIPKTSPKRLDLRANPAYMLHAFPDEEDPEFSIRGRARLVADGEEREIVAAACPFASGVHTDDDVFELDVERADSTRWENWAKADTYPVRRKWIADRLIA